MTTAYSGTPGDGTWGLSNLPYIPWITRLRDGSRVQVSAFRREDWSQGMDLMNHIIREGRTWPFIHEFTTLDEYRGYFLSHTALCVRALDPGVHADGTRYDKDAFLGCFYIKPNFPGRCSHVCNGGFMTVPSARRRGVARLMARVFLQVARDLAYKSAYFNLVFRSNVASVALWESMGFQRVAVLENAAVLQGVDGLDTAYGYRYDLETVEEDYLQKQSIVESIE